MLCSNCKTVAKDLLLDARSICVWSSVMNWWQWWRGRQSRDIVAPVVAHVSLSTGGTWHAKIEGAIREYTHTHTHTHTIHHCLYSNAVPPYNTNKIQTNTFCLNEPIKVSTRVKLFVCAIEFNSAAYCGTPAICNGRRLFLAYDESEKENAHETFVPFGKKGCRSHMWPTDMSKGQRSRSPAGRLKMRLKMYVLYRKCDWRGGWAPANCKICRLVDIHEQRTTHKALKGQRSVKVQRSQMKLLMRRNL